MKLIVYVEVRVGLIIHGALGLVPRAPCLYSTLSLLPSLSLSHTLKITFINLEKQHLKQNWHKTLFFLGPVFCQNCACVLPLSPLPKYFL